MFAPKQYTVLKLNLKYVINNNFNIKLTSENKKEFYIKEQDNMLFRQVRIITDNYDDFNKYVIYIDCKSNRGKNDINVEQLVSNGIYLNEQRFVCCERSASMTRNSIISFVNEGIFDKINEVVTMGVEIEKTVLSKLYAYRGLMLSACHCLENWYPKIIIVPDYYRVIPNQRIKYLCDIERKFTDKNGNAKTYKQKDIAETVRDIEINVFDGCGIHHPKISCEIQTRLGGDVLPTSVLWRLPYIKGVTHEVSYVKFFADRGITEIKDLWGINHSVTEEAPPMIIMFESMYKGLKYFRKVGTSEDWDNYWFNFKKYNHCIGVAKWNFGLDEEPIYTRGNYQILQDLKLNFTEFSSLADYSVKWIEKITDGDPFYTYCFLGLFADRCKPLDNYGKSILKNPEMLKEYGVRNYFINLISKKKEEMKCGKLWLKGSFKFLTADLIMAMEHIGKLKPNGCLEENEFFTQDRYGATIGERVIERNPHICHSEHTILIGTDNEMRQKYCPNLINVCMINGKSITPQKLNGADHDGDLVFVIDNDVYKSGIDRNTITVMDIDDKITVKAEQDTSENKIKTTLRTMTNLIGEYSNYASAYHNKCPKSQEQKLVYNKYIDIISILTGKSIDFAKTGVLYPMPRNIAKFGRPLPYFMRYRKDYYKGIKLSRSNSNMNKLCWKLESWDKHYRWKRTFKDFDFSIMVDNNISVSEDVFNKIEEVFLNFCKEMDQLKKDEREICAETGNLINWNYYYDKFRTECHVLCTDKKALANIAVELNYKKYPNKDKNKKFLWNIAGDGVVENIKQVSIVLPLRDETGDFEYLGRRYSMVELSNTEYLSNSKEIENLEQIESEEDIID